MLHIPEDNKTNYEPIHDLINLLVFLMRKHSNIVDIQINGIACFDKFIKANEEENIGFKILQKIFENTLKDMESFPDNQQIYTNSLIILLLSNIRRRIL
jgi:hypothetical protein